MVKHGSFDQEITAHIMVEFEGDPDSAISVLKDAFVDFDYVADLDNFDNFDNFISFDLSFEILDGYVEYETASDTDRGYQRTNEISSADVISAIYKIDRKLYDSCYSIEIVDIDVKIETSAYTEDYE